MTATASDTDGTITKVDFYRGTQPIGSDTTNSYSVRVTDVAAGTYQLTAVATDSDGVTRRSSPVSVTVSGVTNQPPTVSLTRPAASSTFTAPANITLAATASDADGTVTRVDFYRGSTLIGSDTSSPYSYNWTNVGSGSYQLTAVARDDDGATRTSADASIRVSTTPNQLPTVSITNPINGRSFTAPASLTITAAASDSDGTIARVDFYAGTRLVASDTTNPYQAAWSNVAAGNYSLTAVARDNLGGTRTSSAVAVSITAGAPRPTRVAFTASANHATSVDLVYRHDLSRRRIRSRRARSPRATSANRLRSPATSRSTSPRSSIRCRPGPTRPSCARRVQEARPRARRRGRSRSRAHGSGLRAQARPSTSYSKVCLSPKP